MALLNDGKIKLQESFRDRATKLVVTGAATVLGIGDTTFESASQTVTWLNPSAITGLVMSGNEKFVIPFASGTSQIVISGFELQNSTGNVQLSGNLNSNATYNEEGKYVVSSLNVSFS